VIRFMRAEWRASPPTIRAAMLCCFAGNASLSIIDGIRPRVPGTSPWWLVLGPAPNVVGVFALAGTAVLVVATRGDVHVGRIPPADRRPLWRRAVLGATAALVAWEFLQRHGNLVFDTHDLVATALGTACALACTRWFIDPT
jgi:hypothetical protein